MDIVRGEGGLSWHLGGAPANAAAAASKLGLEVGMIATVGDDFFGAHTIQALDHYRIFREGVRTSKKHPTSLALATSETETTERFTFYRAADTEIKPWQTRAYHIDRNTTFTFGSLSLVAQRLRRVLIDSLTYAQEAGATIIFDANYRSSLWKSGEHFRASVNDVYRFVDVIKVNRVEAEVLTGQREPTEAAKLLHNSGIPIVLITLGEQGCLAMSSAGTIVRPIDKIVESPDVIGTGDAFIGGCIAHTITYGARITDLDSVELGYTIDAGQKSAYEVACVLGAGWDIEANYSDSSR